VREREAENRTREARHLDEIQGVMANTLNSFRSGASPLAKTFGVGFIDWSDLSKLRIVTSLGGDKERGATNHPLAGFPPAMDVAQNIIFF